jgi:hypothetical protein
MQSEDFNNVCRTLKTGTELVLRLSHYEQGELLNGLFLNFTEAGKYPGMMNLITKTGSVAILSDWINELIIVPKGLRPEDVIGQ